MAIRVCQTCRGKFETNSREQWFCLSCKIDYLQDTLDRLATFVQDRED